MSLRSLLRLACVGLLCWIAAGGAARGQQEGDREDLQSASLDQLIQELQRREVIAAAEEAGLPLPTTRGPQDDLTAAAFADLAAELMIRQKALYRNFDERMELREVSDPEVRRVARSVAALVSDLDTVARELGASVEQVRQLDDGVGIHRSEDGGWRLRPTPLERVTDDSSVYGVERRFCTAADLDRTADARMPSVADMLSLEQFRGQPRVSYCTAFLVRPDVVATAAHCLRPLVTRTGESLDRARVVFELATDADGSMPEWVDDSSVYGLEEVLGFEFEPESRDWALLRLDRPVQGRDPLPYDADLDFPEVGTPLYMLGHPNGLSMKYSPNGSVRSVDGDGYLTTDLDSFRGNSGSPVLDDEAHVVRGILVAGAWDFVRYAEKDCVVPYRCAGDRCPEGQLMQERVTLSTAFSLLLESQVEIVNRVNAIVALRINGETLVLRPAARIRTKASGLSSALQLRPCGLGQRCDWQDYSGLEPGNRFEVARRGTAYVLRAPR